MQRLVQDFWKIWSHDYLNTIRQRQKWRQKCKNIEVGDVVLLCENNLPPNVWLLGRVIKVHNGLDNLIRVVTLKTQNSILDRPIVKLCPLPLQV